MRSAEFERTTVEIEARSRRGSEATVTGTGGGHATQLRATGQVLRFDGFLAVYQEGRDDDDDEDGARLPAMASGETVTTREVKPEQHFTEPPPRFTEATLVKRMEELGIGRPSTYAATMSVLRDRGYVRLDKKRLMPEDKGRLVTAFLASFFQRYVETDFTANLEEKLDRISAGELDWKDVLRDFWRDFSANVAETRDLRVSEVLESLNELLGPHIFPSPTDGGDPRACPNCGNGRLSLKLGKFGAFVGCSNYPECRYTRQIAIAGENGEAAENGVDGTRIIGKDPETDLDVSLRTGRFGPYLQLGEASDGDKPKRASIPKGWEPADVDLDRALALLALPRTIGSHPETGEPITTGIGRYGPFVLHQGVYASLDNVEEVFSVGLNRAVALIAEKKTNPRGRGAAQSLRALGDHPEHGGPVTVKSGRYGPYVNHGKINATLPRDLEPETITLESALTLIARKAGGPAKAKTTRAKAAKKTTASKTATTARKAPAKKRAPRAAKTE
jgi:DNA topoisomerase I